MKIKTKTTLLLALLSFAGISLANGTPVHFFSKEEESEIIELMKKELITHPEILIEAGKEIQVKQLEQRNKDMIKAVVNNSGALIGDRETPTYGPKNAKIAVIEFFDYQCIWCARLAPEMENIISSNPQVLYVFKEWPVFGQRWENSILAAKTGLKIWKQKGDVSYLKYHNAVYASGHNEGKLEVKDISIAGKRILSDHSNDKEIQKELNDTDILANKIGIKGTPAIIVMPTEGASEKNVTIFSGFVNADTLQKAIRKAQYPND
ncbi:DsbA family protein [Enterobacter chuandaensis]|uniref:DsbA family protein n=1 Tax=Enterobacter chuandaensis TaxID=2497875 RepID=UPI00300CC36B